MLPAKYLKQAKSIIKPFGRRGLKFFIFGSAADPARKRIGDVDIGVMGRATNTELRAIRSAFEESNFPYFVDIVDFNKVSLSFKKNVFNQKIIWIKKH